MFSAVVDTGGPLRHALEKLLMWRIACLLILLLLGTQNVRAAIPPVTFTLGGTDGNVTVIAAGWMSAERIWFVASAGGSAGLPYTGTPCPAGTTSAPLVCAIWGVIDVRQGTLLSLHGQRDMGVSKAALIGDRLFITGQPRTQALPQSAGSALPPISGNGGYLLVTPPMGSPEFGSYLPADFQVFDIVQVDGDVILAGSAACPECASNNTLSKPARLLRLDAGLTALRYDLVLPGRWSATRHVIDDSGRIHFAAFGSELPTSPQSAMPSRPDSQLTGGELHWGGLVGVDADSGQFAYATYLHIRAPVGIAWDAARGGVWVLGDTRIADFPVTANATDTTFCEPGACVMPGCLIFTGFNCSYPREAALLRVQPDGQRFAHATFVGGPEEDTAMGLYLREDGLLNVLTLAEPIGSDMLGRDDGPRKLTEIDPDAGYEQPSDKQAQARWTYSTYSLAQHPSHGDLFARTGTTLPNRNQPRVVQLAAACESEFPSFRQCFSLLVVEHFGTSLDEATQIPGPRAPLLMLLATLLALTGVAWRFRR